MLGSWPGINGTREEVRKNAGPVLWAEEVRPVARMCAISSERARRRRGGASVVEKTCAALLKTMLRIGLRPGQVCVTMRAAVRGSRPSEVICQRHVSARIQIDPQPRAGHFPLSHGPVGLTEAVSGMAGGLPWH
ncbi:hypothetical protein NDU88_003826 [Pleurodeles waltl]|uniref:Uncharacterized protein n=1 Tax=Pleurodeles waltl TaxID=8319 RepID=A0AAV7NJA7_PLEWA|nr:hypothetical protein NDU88_003826 [Pleurodeles waltl]